MLISIPIRNKRKILFVHEKNITQELEKENENIQAVNLATECSIHDVYGL